MVYILVVQIFYGKNAYEYIEVVNEIPHPKYGTGFDTNGIMLVKLDTHSKAPITKLNFKAYVGNKTNDIVTVLGYGDTDNTEELSKQLR